MLYDVQAFKVASLPVPGWEVYFGENDCSLRAIDFYVWMVRSADFVGLIDLGLPADDESRSALSTACAALDPRSVFHDVRPLKAAYESFGIEPDDVDAAMLTQLVTYSTGGLDLDLLPRAQVYLARAGVEDFLLGPLAHPTGEFYFTESAWAALRELRLGDRLRVTDGPCEVAPGLVFETTGGHHPASAGVIVPTAYGTVGLLETAFTRRNVVEGLPIGIAENAAQCRAAIADYRSRCDHVVPMHEPGLPAQLAGILDVLSPAAAGPGVGHGRA